MVAEDLVRLLSSELGIEVAFRLGLVRMVIYVVLVLVEVRSPAPVQYLYCIEVVCDRYYCAAAHMLDVLVDQNSRSIRVQAEYTGILCCSLDFAALLLAVYVQEIQP